MNSRYLKMDNVTQYKTSEQLFINNCILVKFKNSQQMNFNYSIDGKIWVVVCGLCQLFYLLMITINMLHLIRLTC